MIKSSDFDKAIGLIGEAGSVLLVTHTRPDGDACGCIAALCEVLGTLGKEAKAVFLDDVPQWYEFLFDQRQAILGKDITIEQLKEAGFDLVILVDVNSKNQLPGFAEFLEEDKGAVLVIDHHATAEGLGDVELIDRGAAATALIVFDLFRYAGWKITEKIARALFVAVATDTGWFRFRNTDSRVFISCGELIEAGANGPELYRDLYHNFSQERFKLMAAMLNTVELHFDGRYAVQHLSQEDFERTGANFEDTENLIDECRRIGSVEAAALFVETADGRIKCSLRGSSTIDVLKIAEKFGGGGHKMAAGALLDGPLENAKKLILGEMEEKFKQLDNR